MKKSIFKNFKTQKIVKKGRQLARCIHSRPRFEVECARQIVIDMYRT